MADVNFYNSMLGTYTSFSGADVVATISAPYINTSKETIEFKDIVFGTMQTISISTHRDKFPVRAAGHINARGFTAGPRTIAGSFIFTTFDRDALYEVANQFAQLYYAPNQAGTNVVWDRNTLQTTYKDTPFGKLLNAMADELPLFSVIINVGNEYGGTANMAIEGVTILDQGQTISIDDIVTEQTMSYMAKGIRRLEPGFRLTGTGSSS